MYRRGVAELLRSVFIRPNPTGSIVQPLRFWKGPLLCECEEVGPDIVAPEGVSIVATVVRDSAAVFYCDSSGKQRAHFWDPTRGGVRESIESRLEAHAARSDDWLRECRMKCLVESSRGAGTESAQRGNY